MQHLELRRVIRNILNEAMLKEDIVQSRMEKPEGSGGPEKKKKKGPAKNWEEYVEQTVKKYKGKALVDGAEVGVDYLKDFIKKYQRIVGIYTTFVNILKNEEDKNNPIAKKAAELLADPKILGLSPDMDDSFGDFKKWYMQFNKTEYAEALRATDIFDEDSKWLSAVAVVEAIDSADFIMNQLLTPKGEPKEILQIPPAVAEKPEAEQKAAIQKAGEKLNQVIKDKLTGAADNLKSKLKKTDDDSGGKKGSGLDPEDENYAWTLPKDGVPKDHPSFKAMDANEDGKIGQDDIYKWNMGGMDKYLASIGQTKFRSPDDE